MRRQIVFFWNWNGGKFLLLRSRINIHTLHRSHTAPQGLPQLCGVLLFWLGNPQQNQERCFQTWWQSSRFFCWKKPQRGFFSHSGCFVDKWRWNFTGLSALFDNTSWQIMHCGFGSSSDPVNVNPNAKYSGLYFCFLFFEGGWWDSSIPLIGPGWSLRPHTHIKKISPFCNALCFHCSPSRTSRDFFYFFKCTPEIRRRVRWDATWTKKMIAQCTWCDVTTWRAVICHDWTLTES